MKAEQLGNSYERLKMIGNFRPEPILKGNIKSISDQIFLQDIKIETAQPFLPTPLQTASGALLQAPLLLITITTQCGLQGQSYLFSPSIALLPSLSHAISGVFAIVKGQPCFPETITDTIISKFKLFGGTGILTMAMAAIDIACWDILGIASQQPIYKLLGATSSEVNTYESSGLGIGKIDEILSQAEKYLSNGNSIMKLRLGYDTLNDDIFTLEQLKNNLGDQIQLMVDFNQGLSFTDAKTRCLAIDDYGLLWIEEPVNASALEQSAYLTKILKTPIQIGENLWSLTEVERALSLQSSTYLMPDVGKIGGVTQWIRAAGLAHQYEVKVSTHLYPEISSHLLSAIPNPHYLEYADWTLSQFSGHQSPIDNRLVLSENIGFGLSN
jgi:mandelate racemase